MNFSSSKTLFIVILIIFFLLAFSFFFNAPVDFPIGNIINIKDGSSLRSISRDLKAKNIIRSRVVFETFAIIFDGEKHLVGGDYLFENKLSVVEVARRLVKGERHLARVKVTIPEGFNVFEIAKVFSSKLPNFNEEKFLLEAEKKEGYLFPDTYFFLTTDKEEEVLSTMNNNFRKKIFTLKSQIIASGKSEKDIIIMASIIEKESKGDVDRGLISGILWNRIKIGMPLQADAAPETYKIKGLPKSPICNGGIKAIEAAINPVKSSYFYYLHDKDGNIHYAKTFEEHKINKLKYLR